MGGKGKGNQEKRARPSSSTGDELEKDGRHYEELLALYKALEQKDAKKKRGDCKFKNSPRCSKRGIKNS